MWHYSEAVLIITRHYHAAFWRGWRSLLSVCVCVCLYVYCRKCALKSHLLNAYAVSGESMALWRTSSLEEHLREMEVQSEEKELQR